MDARRRMSIAFDPSTQPCLRTRRRVGELVAPVAASDQRGKPLEIVSGDFGIQVSWPSFGVDDSRNAAVVIAANHLRAAFQQPGFDSLPASLQCRSVDARRA